MTWFYLYVVLAMGWVTLLALNISRLRIKEQVGLGDGGRLPIKKAIRAHINALEHSLPFGFVVFVLAQLQVGSGWLQVLVLGFMASRVGHGVAIWKSHGNLRRLSATGFYLAEMVGLGLIVSRLFE